jgi:hypothetical protein
VLQGAAGLFCPPLSLLAPVTGWLLRVKGPQEMLAGKHAPASGTLLCPGVASVVRRGACFKKAVVCILRGAVHPCSLSAVSVWLCVSCCKVDLGTRVWTWGDRGRGGTYDAGVCSSQRYTSAPLSCLTKGGSLVEEAVAGLSCRHGTCLQCGSSRGAERTTDRQACAQTSPFL